MSLVKLLLPFPVADVLIAAQTKRVCCMWGLCRRLRLWAVCLNSEESLIMASLEQAQQAAVVKLQPCSEMDKRLNLRS